MKLKRSEQIMGGMIALCLPLIYISFISQPQAQKIKDLKASIDTEQTKVDLKQITLQGLIAQAAQATKTMNSNDELKKYLEANRHMSSLLKKLGADEQDRGMVLKDITVGDNKKLNNFYQSSMKVEVDSSFVALGNFLGALSDSESLIEVKSVTLNRIDTDLKRCTATIEVNGYYNEGAKL